MSDPNCASVLNVLHVVGGEGHGGGIMDFVNSIAQVSSPQLRQTIWKHRDHVPPEGSAVRHVCRGVVRKTDVSLFRDLKGALSESRVLSRWIRGAYCDVLHAHSRMGILACLIASKRTGVANMVHFHALAGRPALYRLGWRWGGASPIFNSVLTCRHFGCDPLVSRIVMPPIKWPERPLRRLSLEKQRFVACGRFVPSKNFPVIIKAFEKLGSPDTELHLFGAATVRDAEASGHEREILTLAGAVRGVHVHPYAANWTDDLAADDIFIHLGWPESFGIVIAESYARACRLILLEKTFLSDNEGEFNGAGVFNVSRICPDECHEIMRAAMSLKMDFDNVFQSRRAASHRLDAVAAVDRLTGWYAELVNTGTSRSRRPVP